MSVLHGFTLFIPLPFRPACSHSPICQDTRDWQAGILWHRSSPQCVVEHKTQHTKWPFGQNMMSSKSFNYQRSTFSERPVANWHRAVPHCDNGLITCFNGEYLLVKSLELSLLHFKVMPWDVSLWKPSRNLISSER